MKQCSPRIAVAFLLLASLMALLAACGTPDPTPTPTSTGPTPTQAPGETPEPTATPTPEFDAEAYFRGKTIQMMTSSNPGGGTDLQMRTLATLMSEYIPGNPRIVASNRPPHVVGKNFIYQAPPDGLTIGLFSTSMLREERFPQAEYNSAELTYIADLGDSNYVLTIRGDMPEYKSFEDMIGANGPTLRMMSDAAEAGSIEALLMGNMLIAHFFDIPFEVVRTAERGTGPVLLAFERGDVHWHSWGGPNWLALPVLRPGWLTDGTLIPVLGWTSGGYYTPNDEVPTRNFPHLDDFTTPEQKEMFEGLVHSTLNQVRPLVMPPNVPEGPREALRDAFRTAFHDPEFCAQWESLTGGACEWTEGEIVQQRAAAGREAVARWGDQYDILAAELFEKYVR